MFESKSNTFTSDLLRNPVFLFGLLCLAILGLKKIAGLLHFGPMGDAIATYNYEMVRGKDVKRILTVDDYPTVVRENGWTRPQNRNPMSGEVVKNTMNGPAAPGQAGVTGKKGGTMNAAQAAATAAAKAAQAKRKAQLKVNVIGNDPVKSTGSDPTATHNDVVFHGPAPAVAVAAPAESASSNETKEEEKKLTLNDWRAMLTTASRANLSKLLTAKRAGTISASDYYTLVKELIMSHVDDRQKAGVYVLQNDISSGAFEFIVINKAQTAPAVQAALAPVLKKYEEAAQADELAKVLTTSKRPEVQLEAMKSLTVAITALKKVSTQGEGGGRNPALVAQAQRDFQLLLPSLRRMTATGDEMAGLAADLLAQIESLSQKA